MIPLFAIAIPANAAVIFKQIFLIAAFDFFEIGDPYNEWFGMEPTAPLNANFEAIGFESLYFIHNLGTLFLTLLLIPLILVFIALLSATCCKNCCLVQRVGNYLKKNWQWSGTYKVLHANYGMVSICTLIGFGNLEWEGAGQIICSACSFVGLALLILMPIWTVYVLLKHQDRVLKDKATMVRWNSVFAELKIK